MTEDQAWRELQEQLKSEPELMEDFVSLVLHVLDLKQRTVLALLLVLDSALTPHRREINARLGRPKSPPEWLNQIFANIRDDLYVCWACEKAHTRDSKRWSDGKCMICQGELDHIVCRI